MNLMTALCGSDPYQKELAEVRERYEKTSERVRQLDDMYYQALRKWEEASMKLEKDGKALSDYQKLIENLRERVAEKDAMIAEIRMDCRQQAEGYKHRIADYSAQVARLQGELAKVRKRSAQAKPKGTRKKEQKKTTEKPEPKA